MRRISIRKQVRLCAALLAGSAWAAAAAQTGPYRVAGTVVNAVTGEPVSGAMVALLTVQGSSTFAATESGEDGRFDIENLPAAKLQLTASKRGYCTGFYNQHGDYNSAVVTGEGQDTGNLVFRLAPEAVLSGVVTGDGGDPVAGATVLLFEEPRGHDPGAKIDQANAATTDDTGAYEFADLAAGEYLLAVRAQPWYAMSQFSTNLDRRPESEQQAALDVAYPVTFFDSTTDESSATPIMLAGGSRQQANVSLHAVPALHIQVQMPRRPDGSPGNPVTQPELRRTIFGLDVAGGDVPLSRGRDGSVEFAGVAPGPYVLTQGDPPRVVDLNASQSQQVDPGAGTPAFAVNGRLDPEPGTTLDGGTVVTLEPVQEPVASDAVAEPQPAFAGQRAFTINAVTPGAWRMRLSNGLDVVSITADGRTRPGNLLTVQDHALDVTVTVSAGRSVRIAGVAERLDGSKSGATAERSSSEGDKSETRTSQASKFATSTGGKGFAGAMILLVPRNLKDIAELGRRDQSDSDGSFALLNVEPGEYTVVAIADGWDLDWGNPAVIARYLPGGETVTVKDSPESRPGRRMTLAEPVAVQPR
jgi:Carboxypeptidase regulatory-like domain